MTTATTPPLEHHEQAALVRWAALNEWHEPRLTMLFAIPNGGPRAKSAGAKLRAEGVRPGAPDLMLAAPGVDAPALFIELKRVRGGGLSDDQRMTLARLRRHGYRAEMCRGWIAAANVICEYLGREDMAVPS